jgi:hypothetical protein
MCTLLSQLLDKIQKYQHLWHKYLRDVIHVETSFYNRIAPLCVSAEAENINQFHSHFPWTYWSLNPLYIRLEAATPIITPPIRYNYDKVQFD